MKNAQFFLLAISVSALSDGSNDVGAAAGDGFVVTGESKVGVTFKALSKGAGVNSTPLKESESNPQVESNDGTWIKAIASCYGHYDWQDQHQNPKHWGAVACKNKGAPMPQGSACTGGYGDTTCTQNQFQPGQEIIQTDMLYGTAFSYRYWGSPYDIECGKCLLARCADEKCKAQGTTIKLKVVDQMGDKNRTFDINDGAYKELTGNNCYDFVSVEWRPVDCECTTDC